MYIFDYRSMPKAVFAGSVCAAALLAAGSPAHAAGTLAGTSIDNTATATYDDGAGGTITEDSNTVQLIVDEILDIAVAWDDPGDVSVGAGDSDSVLTFTVTNGGNGPEDVLLAIDPGIGGDDFDPTAVEIYIDTNGNGVYDPGVDTLYDPGNPPNLDPDESVTIFIVGDIPAGVSDGDRGGVRLTGRAGTGNGAPGTVFSGAGEGGGDAVVGSTGADDDDDGFYAVQAIDIALNKAAAVRDPFGGTTQVPGSIITYTLTSAVTGTGTLPGVVIADPVPAGTTYVTGSMTLDGAALTDIGDADEGEFDGSAVSVTLGDVTADQTNVITFQVEID